jgi:hypothetical protein
MSAGPNTIRVTLRRAFDRHGNRLRGRFVAIIGDQQLCIDPALPIASWPAEANFDALTSTIDEAAKWAIEESGTVSARNAWRRP